MPYIIVPTIVAFLFLVASSCSNDQPGTSEQDVSTNQQITLSSGQMTELGIELDRAHHRDLSNELRVHGILEVPPQYLLSVNAPLGGIVRKTEILPGEHVSKGDVLVQLEGLEFIKLQEEYLSVEAELVRATLELERQQDLAKDNINARRNLEQAVASERVLRIKRKALAEQLSLIGIDAGKLTDVNLSRIVSLRAPFNGYVTEVFVNTGSAVEPNGRLLEMVDPTHLHVELRVFERDARRIHAQQRLSILIAGEQEERPGHIHVVGTEISNDRSVLVHGHLDIEDHTLRPGTTLLARILTDQAQTLAVPSEAVVSMNGRPHVFVQSASTKDGIALRAVEVATGATQDGFTGISAESLDTSATVVVKGAHRIRSIISNTEAHGH